MKKLFSRVISIFAVFALISCGLISCSDIENNESGSVSFSISPDLAKAVLGAGRSARAETDPPDGVTGEPEEKPYRISVVMSGDKNETQSEKFTEKDWEDISNGGKTAPTFTFNDIRVGSEIVVSATIYYGTGERLVWPCMTGSSDTVKIMEGENPVSFNVHKLARVNLYNNTESGETISDISKLDVYALPKGSEVANKILALVAKDDSKNDPEIYEILSAYSKIYSYSKPDSPYLTGGYELKNGAEVYMLSLLYTSDGVYLGHPDVSSSSETLPQDALTVIKIDEVNNIHLKLMKMDLDYTYIFPAKYEDKEVSAWYVGENYDGQADYNGTPCIKTETSAVFLFSDKTFVITSHKIKKSTSGEEIYEDEIKYVMRGNYELSGDDFANGTFTLTPTAKYVEGRGWVALSEATQEQQKLVCEVTNGKFTPSSMEESYEFSMKSDSDYLRVYRGEIDDTESGASDISAFLPKKFADRTVAAWYAYYGSDYTEAVFLFAEGEFVTTKHKYSQNSGEVRTIQASGEYSLSGTPNDYDNNRGTAQFKDGDDEIGVTITITNGVMTVSKMSSDAYARQSLAALPAAQDETSGSDEPEPSSDFTNLAFFPSDYADKTVLAWYASEKVSTDKTKIYALYLFGDNTFVATKREIQDSGETREIDQQGKYTFEGKADFENGEGTALVESKEYSFSIVDGLFSIAGVDTTYNFQTGSVPKAQSETESGDISAQFNIQFLFQTKEGVDDYAERSELPTATCDVDAVSEYEEITAEATKKAIRLGYDFNEDKTDDEPVLVNGVYVIRLYFDLKDYGSLFTATSTAAEGSSGDSSVYSQSGFKLTVYENLVYEITYTDGSTVTDARSVSKGIYDTTQSGVVITATEEEYFDFVAAEGDLSKLASGEYELTVVTDPKQQTLSISSGFFTFESAGGPLITFKIDSEQASSSISVKLDSIDGTDLGGKIELSVTEDGKSVKITASPDESITVSQYKLILFEGQEQLSPEGALDSSTNSYVWTLTENIINNLSAGNHQITVSVIIADKLYTASTNLTITK